MSASQKKKLRNEQNAVQLTEKQVAEQKEAKKLRLYTAIFTIAIVLMLCVVLVTTVIESGLIQRNTTAATVSDSKISAPELNYYYVDSVTQFQREWGDAFMFSGLALDTPFNEQVRVEETGETWADYFMDRAAETMRYTYALYTAAKADGYVLSEEDTTVLDNMMQRVELDAMMTTGARDLKTYLKAAYGAGANEDSYREYLTVQFLASKYAMDHADSLTYSAEQIREKDAADPSEYNSYSYNQYYLSTTPFLQGGTKDDEGIVTYSPEEKAAAAEAAKAAMDGLVETLRGSESAVPTTAEDLDAAIAGIAGILFDGEPETAKSTPSKDLFKNQIPSVLTEWVISADRKAGDLTVIPNESTVTDAEGNSTTTAVGYYVVLFNGVNDNTNKISNVRHILVKYEGGMQDANGVTTYSAEEKEAAGAEAAGILAQFQAGETTEEAFAALATEKSDDTGSAANGGLIEDILPSSPYVENFLNWAVDPARVAGETGIIETEYGYHVMYYVGDSELNYRDTMIRNVLVNEAMTEWENSMVEPVTLEITNPKHVPMDMVLYSRAQ